MNIFEKLKIFFFLISKKFKTVDDLTENQKLALEIFKLGLYDENNVRLLNSDSQNKKYIVTKSYAINGDVSTFMILQNSPNANLITIVNNEFKYDISIPSKTFSQMSKMFDKKVEEDRKKMEDEIFSNITQSLETVYKQFKNVKKSIDDEN